MTDRITRDGQRGTAVIFAVLSLALLLAMAMGISITAISELGTSNQLSSQTIAFQSAEAGLNHAVSLIANYQESTFTDLLNRRPITTANPNFSYVSQEDYVTRNLSAFNPFVSANAAYFTPGVAMIDYDDASRGHPLLDAVTGAPVDGVFYRVSLVDDEPATSTAPVRVPNFNPGPAHREGVAPNASDPGFDKNYRLVVYSTGTYANASVTLEGWVSFLPYPAFTAERDITVGGNCLITGLYGGIHSNRNLLIDNGGGQNWRVEQSFTATGSILPSTNEAAGHVGGFYGGGQEALEIPPFVTSSPLSAGGPNTSPRLQDFLIRAADRLLIDPAYAHQAHRSDPNGSGDGVSSSATGRLRSLAERLNVTYQSLAEATDQDNDQGKVDQTGPVAVAITRDPGTGVGTAGKIADLSQTGWSYSPGTNASWAIVPNNNGLQAGGHTYYVVGLDNYNLASPGASTRNGGNVNLTGNVGSSGAPLQITILATGSIYIQGTPNMTANLTDFATPLLPPFVRVNMLLGAVQDIKVTGDNNSAISFTGVSYAGEQVELSGSGDVNGQVISKSNPHVGGTPVSGNAISGWFNLTLNDGKAVGKIKLYSWRQIKR